MAGVAGDANNFRGAMFCIPQVFRNGELLSNGADDNVGPVQ